MFTSKRTKGISFWKVWIRGYKIKKRHESEMADTKKLEIM